jgi:putative hydrolase of the HAD superfamily
MPTRLTTIGFDADDTLWQNERFFRLTQERFANLLLLAAERRNIGHYGFGVKGFVLSMIETAIEVTDGRVPNSVIAELLAAGQDMLSYPIELLPHVADTIAQLAPDFHLVLITKGDLLDQERKLAQSGLGDMFNAVEIVSDKTPDVYSRLFTRHGSGPEQALMVGNSLKSDVIPALSAGAWGVHIPHGQTWALEHADPPTTHLRYRDLPDLGGLVALIHGLHT